MSDQLAHVIAAARFVGRPHHVLPTDLRIADAVRAHLATLNPDDAHDLVEENRSLRAHLQDRSDEAKVRNVDAYETRKDLEALVEALVERCQQATDENADARWMLMELRTILACRLPFDEDYAERLFAQPRGLRATIEAYLRSVGFVSAIYPDGREGWGHPELGYGRYFEDAVTWWIGREKAKAPT